MLLQLLFVLAAIIVGARLGGIGLGVMGGVGLASGRRIGLYGQAGRTFAAP